MVPRKPSLGSLARRLGVGPSDGGLAGQYPLGEVEPLVRFGQLAAELIYLCL
jgi:hypothetical protein